MQTLSAAFNCSNLQYCDVVWGYQAARKRRSFLPSSLLKRLQYLIIIRLGRGSSGNQYSIHFSHLNSARLGMQPPHLLPFKTIHLGIQAFCSRAGSDMSPCDTNFSSSLPFAFCPKLQVSPQRLVCSASCDSNVHVAIYITKLSSGHKDDTAFIVIHSLRGTLTCTTHDDTGPVR